MYILQLMDDHCASFAALIIGFVELAVLMHVYGVNRFIRQSQKMLGTFPMCGGLWKVLWIFVTPNILIVSIWNYCPNSSI